MKYEGFKISKESVDKLFPKGDIDIFGYESPIQMLTNQFASEISKKADENIWEAVVKTEVVVDKDELVKALQYDRDQYEKGYINGYYSGLNADKWISVEERLPEENGSYLVVGKTKTAYTSHFYKKRIIHGKVFSAHFSNKYITHWMPLPEPPRESEDA